MYRLCSMEQRGQDRKRQKSDEITEMVWWTTLDRFEAVCTTGNRRKQTFLCGGEGWIRTSVRLRGQIYSLLPLTTRPPLQGAGRRAMWRHPNCVSTRVNTKVVALALLRRSNSSACSQHA